jgi:hypothetical protein
LEKSVTGLVSGAIAKSRLIVARVAAMAEHHRKFDEEPRTIFLKFEIFVVKITT